MDGQVELTRGRGPEELVDSLKMELLCLWIRDRVGFFDPATDAAGVGLRRDHTICGSLSNDEFDHRTVVWKSLIRMKKKMIETRPDT